MARTALVTALGCLMAAVVLGLALPRLVEAKEPGPPPFRTVAGPYQITVEERLSGLSLGYAEFFVTVQEAATGRPIPDAHVALWVQGPRSTKRVRSLALGGPDAPGRYLARINLDSPGTWLVAVEVSSPLGTESVEAPPVQVPATRRFSQGSLVFIGVALVLLAGGTYVWWSTRRARRTSLDSSAPTPPTGGQR